MPSPWKPLAALASGLALGLGLALLGSRFAGDRPSDCLSCHPMQEAHSRWRAGAHRQQGCAECHLPPGLLARTWARGATGVSHATTFALGWEAAHPRLGESGVVEANCRRCHAASRPMHPISSRPCLDCHGDAGHAQALARR